MRIQRSIFLLPAVLLFCLAAAHADEGKRVALIVGNNNYPMAPLKNAVNDARMMDQALRNAGFRTILRENTSQSALEEAVAEFLQQLGPDDTALFFYAGHGVQIENENFLVPVDFTAATSVIQAKLRCFRMAGLLDGLKSVRPKRSVVVLDACRSNPVAESQKLEGGLAQPQNAGKETYIAYSTGPGQVAADNPEGRNSYFTEALADMIAQPGLALDEVFTRVRSRVSSETSSRQVPWSISNLTARFYFFPPSDASAEADSTLAEKWMEEARGREQREEWREALAFVEQVLHKKPGGTIEALAARKLPYLKARSEADARYEASEFAAAAALEEEALKIDPFALDAAFRAVNGYLLSDRLPDAVRLLQTIRVRGTTASLQRAEAMLKALAPAEPEAGRVLQAGIQQPPPVEEVLSGSDLHAPDFDAADRFLTSTPIDLSRWAKELTSALAQPAPVLQVASASASAPAATESVAPPNSEAQVAKAMFHLEIVPAGDTRDIAIRRIGAGAGPDSPPPEYGFVELRGSDEKTPVLLGDRVMARELPAKMQLPAGKYEIRMMQGGTLLSSNPLEVAAAKVVTVTIGSRQ